MEITNGMLITRNIICGHLWPKGPISTGNAITTAELGEVEGCYFYDFVRACNVCCYRKNERQTGTKGKPDYRCLNGFLESGENRRKCSVKSKHITP